MIFPYGHVLATPGWCHKAPKVIANGPSGFATEMQLRLCCRVRFGWRSGAASKSWHLGFQMTQRAASSDIGGVNFSSLTQRAASCAIRSVNFFDAACCVILNRRSQQKWELATTFWAWWHPPGCDTKINCQVLTYKYCSKSNTESHSSVAVQIIPAV